jgi:predicted O-methyltransferase YrrM
MSTTTDSLDRSRSVAATIEGWLTDAEGELLFRLARSCPDGLPIVEIGSWKGKSTVWLAGGVRDRSLTKVFAIDPHEASLEDPAARTLDALRANLARAEVSGTVVPIVTGSHDAAPGFIETPGVIFVDGSHLEEAVRIDLDDWFPKLADGGVLALHDVLNDRWSGPRRALRGLLWRSRQLAPVQFVDSIAWMKKVKRNSGAELLRNRLAVLLLVAYEIRPNRLPGPIAALLRAVYRQTPLKRRPDPDSGR